MNLLKRLLRALKAYRAEGLLHFKPPPDIEGKHDYGIKPNLTFFFDTEEQKEFVYRAFKEGRSRIPSGRKLYEFVKAHWKTDEQTRLP